MKKSIILVVTSMLFTITFTSCLSTPATEQNVNKQNAVEESTNQDFLPFTDLVPAEEPEKKEAEKKAALQKEADSAFLKSIENINISLIKPPLEATMGNNFVRPFTISVKKGQGAEAVPASSFPITIRYPSSKADGKLVYTTENVVTDEQGMYVFTAPKTSFSAAGDFSVYPTYTPALEADAPAVEISEEVKNNIADKSANTPWLVKSDLASKGGILVVWEFNERDRFQGNCSDLMSELRSRNVKNVTNAPYSDSSYIGQPMENVYRDNASLLADMELSYGYMVYGTIKFSKDVTPNEDGTYSCALVGDIQAINMSDGSVKMHKIFEQEATGKGWNDVVGKCKSKLMSKIVDSLLYEL